MFHDDSDNYKTMKEMDSTPDYARIYSDLIDLKYPHKKEICKPILKKKRITVLDVIELNNEIFENSDKNSLAYNQRHRAYSKRDILFILDYQKKYRLNNSQLAVHFKLSRNTVTKWRRLFLL